MPTITRAAAVDLLENADEIMLTTADGCPSSATIVAFKGYERTDEDLADYVVSAEGWDDITIRDPDQRDGDDCILDEDGAIRIPGYAVRLVPLDIVRSERSAAANPEPAGNDRLATALRGILACARMRGPAGTTAYLISDERWQAGVDALAEVDRSAA